MLPAAHGPLLTDAAATLAAAHRRAQRLVDDPDGAVWYGARRIFAFALTIRSGLPLDQVGDYLLERAWLADAARLLGGPADVLARELLDTMRRGRAILERDGRLHAAADHTPVPPAALDQPLPGHLAERGESVASAQRRNRIASV